MDEQIDGGPIIRRIETGDSMIELTDLLHLAYAPLAERGLHFVATHQDIQTTAKRIAGGECFLAIHERRIIATLTWYPASRTGGSPWLDRADVASCAQFCVHPQHQRQGMGSRLLAIAERRTLETGATELALDTAEPAEDLIRFYVSRGFRFIEHVQWKQVNYRSVRLSKRVAPQP